MGVGLGVTVWVQGSGSGFFRQGLRETLKQIVVTRGTTEPMAFKLACAQRRPSTDTTLLKLAPRFLESQESWKPYQTNWCAGRSTSAEWNLGSEPSAFLANAPKPKHQASLQNT